MKSLIVLGAFVAVMGGVLAYGHFFQITEADRSGLGQACAKWISEDFADGRPTEISDVWRKNGKFVFEVLKGGFANQLGDKKTFGLFSDHIVWVQFGAIGQVGFELREQTVEPVAAQGGYGDRFFYAEFVFKGLL